MVLPSMSPIAPTQETAAEQMRRLMQQEIMVGQHDHTHSPNLPLHAHTHPTQNAPRSAFFGRGVPQRPLRPEECELSFERDPSSMSTTIRLKLEATGQLFALNVPDSDSALDRRYHGFPDLGSAKRRMAEAWALDRMNAEFFRPTISRAEHEEALRRKDAEIERLRGAFDSTFGVPIDSVLPAESETSAGQVRVRVTVKGFTVESTMGLLAAATAHPERAVNWWHESSRRQAAEAESRRAVGSAVGGTIVTRILSPDNEMVVVKDK